MAARLVIEIRGDNGRVDVYASVDQGEDVTESEIQAAEMFYILFEDIMLDAANRETHGSDSNRSN